MSTLPPTAAPYIKATFDLSPALEVIAELHLKVGWLDALETKLEDAGIFDEVDLAGHFNVAYLRQDAYDAEALQDAAQQADKVIAAFYKNAKRWKK